MKLHSGLVPVEDEEPCIVECSRCDKRLYSNTRAGAHVLADHHRTTLVKNGATLSQALVHTTTIRERMK